MNRKTAPSRSLALELYHYDPETGLFRHRFSRGNRAAGSIAGSHRKNGSLTLRVGKLGYYAHHIAWLITHNEWPDRLDHKDVNKSNNKIKNLRKATASQNGANHYGWAKKDLPKGVTKKTRKKYCRYQAQIKVKRRTISLGYFNTIEEARQAYLTAAKKHFGEFAR